MRSSRSRSRRRKVPSYQVEGNQLVDARSKQLLFREFEISTLGRTILKGEEAFSQSTADSLLDKHMKRKRASGMVNFLVDRIRFGKKSGSGTASNREYLTYREIKHFYRASVQPSVFTLCVEEEQTGRRCYETYMCKTVQDVAPIHSLIRQATSDPQFLLRQHAVTYRSLSPTSSDSSIFPYEIQRPPTTHPTSTPHNRQSTITVYSTYDDSTHVHAEPTSVYHKNRVARPSRSHRSASPLRIEKIRNTSPDSFEYRRTPTRESNVNHYPFVDHTVPVENQSPVFRHFSRTYIQPTPTQNYGSTYSPQQEAREVIIRRYIQMQQEDEATQPLMTTLRSSSNEPIGKDNVTYLRSNADREPEVADRGPVYMYVSRSRRTEPSLHRSPNSVSQMAMYQ